MYRERFAVGMHLGHRFLSSCLVNAFDCCQRIHCGNCHPTYSLVRYHLSERWQAVVFEISELSDQGIYLMWFVSTYIVMQIVLFFNSDDHTSFMQNYTYNLISTIGEPLITFSVCCGCLACGINLQLYVAKVKFNSQTQLRILMHLNITLVIILVSYMLRSIMVLTLSHFMPLNYTRTLSCNYIMFTLLIAGYHMLFVHFV